jgi:PAS domain S-box-containing protein
MAMAKSVAAYDRRALPDRRVTARATPDRRAPIPPRIESTGPSERDARLARTYDLAPIGLAHVTPDERWIEVNQRLLDFLGYSREELLGLQWVDFTHPEDIPADRVGRARLLAGEVPQHRLEKRYIRKDGTIVWARLTMSLVRTAAGTPDYMIAAVEDITAQKLAEAEARATKRGLEHVAANIPGVAYQLLVRPDGRVELPCVSDGSRELFGLPAEAFQNEPALLLNAIHPADRPSWEATVAESAESLSPWRWEGRVVLPNGEERWVEGATRPNRQPDGGVLWSGVLLDITARRRTLSLLAGSEQRHRSLFEHHPDAVFSLDLEGRFQKVNPRAEAVSGFSPEELLGQSYQTLIVPEHLDRANRAFEASLAGEARTYETAIRHKSGRRVELSVTSIPMKAEGEVVGVFGMARDLTLQHSLEAQLRQAQKMEAVGRLAGGIAHDFNNLLMAILANAELVLDESGGRAIRQDVETIRYAAERATSLTRQLLDFSRHQSVEPRHLDVNGVVRDTERLLRRTIGEGITLELDLAPAPGRVRADAGQLEQVLVNLGVNARDAMPRGGRLVLRTGTAVVEEADIVNHLRLRPGSYVTVAVEDTGVGMSADLQSRIFEPFFTTKPVGQGTGLGLATVYAIVERWDGYTEVRSAPGEGTTVTIYLPRATGTPELDEPKAVERAVHGSETILVVEDEPTVRRSVVRMLSRRGYNVLEAANGADALQVLKHPPTPVDLVLTDVVMPVMDGHELIAALRARPGGPKILVMSGYDRRAKTRGEQLPSDVIFIEKPFTSEELFQGVHAALGRGEGLTPPAHP